MLSFPRSAWEGLCDTVCREMICGSRELRGGNPNGRANLAQDELGVLDLWRVVAYTPRRGGGNDEGRINDEKPSTNDEFGEVVGAENGESDATQSLGRAFPRRAWKRGVVRIRHSDFDFRHLNFVI